MRAACSKQLEEMGDQRSGMPHAYLRAAARASDARRATRGGPGATNGSRRPAAAPILYHEMEEEKSTCGVAVWGLAPVHAAAPGAEDICVCVIYI